MKEQFESVAPSVYYPLRRSYQTVRAWYEARIPDRWEIERLYRRSNGFRPDLSNPKDLSEKILWLTLNRMTPLHGMCTDKIGVRRFVAERVGTEVLIPLLQVIDNVEDVRPDRIDAETFVIKASHDNGSTFICHDRREFRWDCVRSALKQRLRKNFYKRARERQYRNIVPRILVEQLIENSDGSKPMEYKVLCIAGKPVLIQVNMRSGQSLEQAFFDLEWNRLHISRQAPVYRDPIRRPERLSDILSIAAKLAREFEFVRVDLYESDGHLWFGETTFTPAAGLVRFSPPEFERHLGDMLALDL